MTPYLLPRVLLITAGECAAALAAQVDALSCEWLRAPPPLRRLDGGRLPDTLTAICDELAADQLAVTLRNAGYELATSDAIRVWLLIDTQHATPPGAADNASADLLNMVTETIWRRLRLPVQHHALLLAEPDDDVAAWLYALRTPIVNQVWLVGPVNHDHLRLDEEGWRGQAATALATVLWGALPRQQQEQTEWQLQIVGADAWPSPRHLLHRWLAAQSVRAALAGLRSATLVDKASPIAQPATLAQQIQALSACQPPASALLRWPERRPAWRNLPQFATHVVAGVRHQAGRRAPVAHQAREQWLSEQRAGWEAQLARLVAARLNMDTASPGLTLLGDELERLRDVLEDQSATASQRLADTVQQLERSQERWEASRDCLAALCADFPTPSLTGWLVALRQPWRWPGWFWRYQFELPRTVQALLEAAASLDHSQAHEADWRALHELQLNMLQHLQEQVNRVTVLIHHLDQIDAALARQQEQLAAQLLPPWNEERLNRLASQVAPSMPVRLHELLSEPEPLGAVLKTGADDLAHWWQEQVTEQLAQRWPWSPLDCLRLALTDPGAAQPLPDDMVWCDWLTNWIQHVRPLWPRPELPPNTHTCQWLLTPGSQPDNTSAAAQSYALLRDWAEPQPQLNLAPHPMEGLLALTWVTLATNEEERQRAPI